MLTLIFLSLIAFDARNKPNRTMSSTNNLLDFAKKLEQKNIVTPETGINIRGFIRKLESASSWQQFLIIGGVLGALFCSAGVFSIISHNWDDFPKHFRGFLSFIPVLVALYFYYVAIFKHKDSKTWIEASSLFLMLMIGASIALVTQTYQMDGDFTDFMKVWMVLTIPLFYIARASVISGFYLLLILLLLFRFENFFGIWIPVDLAGEHLYWFWLLVLAFLPHYYLALNRDSQKQGPRVIYMSYFLYISVAVGLGLTVKSNFILWFATFHTAFYLIGKRYMSDNENVFARPFQWLPQLFLITSLIGLSSEDALYWSFRYDTFFNYEYWSDEQTYYFILLIVVMAGVYFNFFRSREKYKQANYLVVLAPLFLMFTMIVDEYTTSWWWLSLLFNFYVLIIAVTTIIHGSADGKVFKMAAGLIVIAALLAIRYVDTDLGFITKGIVFLGVGGVFFLINLLVKDKVDDIERHKRLSNEK